MTGAYLKYAILTFGLTQREFARRVGLTEEHISRLIQGKGPIRPHFRILIRCLMIIHEDDPDLFNEILGA